MKRNESNSTPIPQKTQSARILAVKSSVASFVANLGALTLYPLEAIKTRLQGTFVI